MKNHFGERRSYAFLGLICVALLLGNFAMARDEFPRRGFTVVAWDQKIGDLYFSDATGEHPLRAFPRRRSPYYDYIGPDELVFYHKISNDKGEEVRLPVGQFRLSGEYRDWLLVFFPKVSGGFRVLGFPSDSITANEAGYQFINLSNGAVAGVLGGEVFRIESGKSWAIPAEGIHAEGKSAVIKLALRVEENWELFYETFWPSRKGERWLVFVYPDDQGDLQLLKIREKIAQ